MAANARNGRGITIRPVACAVCWLCRLLLWKEKRLGECHSCLAVPGSRLKCPTSRN